jgi:hypothetical protein
MATTILPEVRDATGVITQPRTVIQNTDGQPIVTLFKEGDFWKLTLEVEGLDPQRNASAEERSLGIKSLSPPEIRVRARRKPADTHRALIDIGTRAVSAAATSTTGETGGPGGILMSYLRTATAIRWALRAFGEDI